MIHYVVRIIWYSAGGLENNLVGQKKKKKEMCKHYCELEDWKLFRKIRVFGIVLLQYK